MEDNAQLPNQYHEKAMKSTLAQSQKYPGIQLNITFTANADTTPSGYTMESQCIEAASSKTYHVEQTAHIGSYHTVLAGVWIVLFQSFINTEHRWTAHTCTTP